MARAALSDMDVALVWQAWRLRRWAGSGGAVGHCDAAVVLLRGRPGAYRAGLAWVGRLIAVMLQCFAWHAWHLVTLTLVCVAGMALASLNRRASTLLPMAVRTFACAIVVYVCVADSHGGGHHGDQGHLLAEVSEDGKIMMRKEQRQDLEAHDIQLHSQEWKLEETEDDHNTDARNAWALEEQDAAIFSHRRRRTKTDCVWLPWGQYSTCSKTCGTGEQSRTRSKISESGGGDPCTGPAEPTHVAAWPCRIELCEGIALAPGGLSESGDSVRRPAALENSLAHGKCKLTLLTAERPALAQLRRRGSATRSLALSIAPGNLSDPGDSVQRHAVKEKSLARVW
eukprot:s4452_g3.t1